MGLVGKSGATILQNDHSIVGVGGMARRRLDDEFGGHTHQHDRVEDIRLLAILSEGAIQLHRVGGTGGGSTKYMARKDAGVVGLFSSGIENVGR